MGTPPNSLIHLLNEYQVAEMLGVSLATVRRWRLLNHGPRYLKLGALCKYRMEDISAWVDSRPSGVDTRRNDNERTGPCSPLGRMESSSLT
ncbi:MAG: helix-turn-helix domain-containing protein [Bryobacteraceae bacterium]|jgi:predicted DNA-binding transcriptional regulator AlpA